ncbi:hypothetical protein AAC387_Pa12g1253 [Persea americana]
MEVSRWRNSSEAKHLGDDEVVELEIVSEDSSVDSSELAHGGAGLRERDEKRDEVDVVERHDCIAGVVREKRTWKDLVVLEV